jgi:hypothetical protein
VDTTSEAFFDAIYERSGDPWSFATDPTERARYADIVSLLGDTDFRSGFEPGCSIGELTVMLAPHCQGLLATDISPRAVASARRRCGAMANVVVHHGRLPDALPAPGVDLVVLSEIGYYFTADELVAVLDALADLATPVRCSSARTGPVSPDHVLSGAEVHRIIGAPPMEDDHQRPTAIYVIGSWTRRWWPWHVVVVIPARDGGEHRALRSFGSTRRSAGHALATGISSWWRTPAPMTRIGRDARASGHGDRTEAGSAGAARRRCRARLGRSSSPAARMDSEHRRRFDRAPHVDHESTPIGGGRCPRRRESPSPRLRRTAATAFTANYRQPRRTHSHVHGANLGIRADAYLAAGGWSDMLIGEDHDSERVRKTHVGVWTTASYVHTSARRRARPNGFAALGPRRDDAVMSVERTFRDLLADGSPARRSVRRYAERLARLLSWPGGPVSRPLVEAHVDAVQILHEGRRPFRLVVRVWAAEDPRRSSLRTAAAPGASLSGTKAFCTGAARGPSLDHGADPGDLIGRRRSARPRSSAQSTRRSG